MKASHLPDCSELEPAERELLRRARETTWTEADANLLESFPAVAKNAMAARTRRRDGSALNVEPWITSGTRSASVVHNRERWTREGPVEP